MREDMSQSVRVHAGFPNPAADKSLSSLDLHQLLVPQPSSTYLFRVRGHEWQAQGIFDGDIAVINRALTPRGNDIVIWWHEAGDEFAISAKQQVPSEATVWGVVTSTIHQFRKDTL